MPFGWEQYEALADRMATIKGRAILTINDHPDIRRLFKGLPVKSVPIRYTIGGMQQAASRRELIYRSPRTT